jgi:hypothetical protein
MQGIGFEVKSTIVRPAIGRAESNLERRVCLSRCAICAICLLRPGWYRWLRRKIRVRQRSLTVRPSFGRIPISPSNPRWL